LTAQKLDRVLTCYRIGDPHGAYPIFDTTGSTINPGRWNTSVSPVLYTSEYYSTAMLEKLVHGSGKLPPNQHFTTGIGKPAPPASPTAQPGNNRSAPCSSSSRAWLPGRKITFY
jgi:RES domain-containing protein